MSDNFLQKDEPRQDAPAEPGERSTRAIYHVRVRGHLDSEWFRDWFDGFTIRPVDDGTCVISGPVEDQAALFGLLSQLRDAGLRLISLDCDPADGGLCEG